MTEWIDDGVMVWLGEVPGDDETVLVFFKGVGAAAMREGLIAQHRPPFAHGEENPPGEWGAVVHHLHHPARGEFGDTDYRRLCPPGAELVVFVPNPCLAKGHGPQMYHYRDGEAVSCVDYEDPEQAGEYWPNELAPFIAAAGIDYENENYDRRLTRLICDHLGLPELERGAVAVDRDLIASYFQDTPAV
ncbi:hypothetical protein [Streptomyces sp. NPDC058953]|uniref:hypothetical protein n=1 Tax=unclassified Streptomyces TaxID=2593676 RepID=UPI00367B974F